MSGLDTKFKLPRTYQNGETVVNGKGNACTSIISRISNRKILTKEQIDMYKWKYRKRGGKNVGNMCIEFFHIKKFKPDV